MQITLYKFSKRINSTRRPTGGGTVVEVSIKQNVPVANSFSQSADTYLTMPVFFLSTLGQVSGNPNDYNYCQAFGHYYWISNIEIGLDNTLVLYCQMDVLASFKYNIVGTAQYASYSSTAGIDIDDGRNLMLPGCTRVNMGQGRIWEVVKDNNGEPHQIVSIVDILDDNGIFTYVCDKAEWTMFWRGLMGWSDEVSTDLLTKWSQVYGGMLNVIGSLQRTSLQPSQFDTTSKDIVLGGSEIVQLQRCNTDSNLRKTLSISLKNKAEGYMQGSRWTRYYVHLPFAGIIELNPGMMADASEARVISEISMSTLDVAYWVFTDKGFAGEAYGNAGSTTPYGQLIDPNTAKGVYVNQAIEKGVVAGVNQTLEDVVSFAGADNNRSAMPLNKGASRELINGGIAVTHGLFTMLTTTANSYLDAMPSGYAQAQSATGVLGGTFGKNFGASYSDAIIFWRDTANSMYSPGALAGRYGNPCNAIIAITDNMGFVKVPDPVIELDTVSDIISQIITYMRGGIYVE